MVDKDDLFKEEDDTSPQDQDRDDSSSDEEDEIIDLLDTVDIPAEDIEEDIIELEETIEEPEDEIIELEEVTLEPEADNDVLDLTEMVTDVEEPRDDILELADIAAADDAEDDEALDLIQKTDTSDIDDDIIDLTKTDEPLVQEQKEQFEETAALPSAGYEEDKELLELIDDIQATLNDEPAAARAGTREDNARAGELIDANTVKDDADEYTLLDDDEIIQGEDVAQSESEFVDHLGIDLTSEIERKALENGRESVREDVQPTESMDAGIAPDALESAVKQALGEMLADENNPLVKAIESAVKKALGQGEDT